MCHCLQIYKHVSLFTNCLFRYVDEGALLRRHSQTEDDNPPSPMAIGGHNSGCHKRFYFLKKRFSVNTQSPMYNCALHLLRRTEILPLFYYIVVGAQIPNALEIKMAKNSSIGECFGFRMNQKFSFWMVRLFNGWSSVPKFLFQMVEDQFSFSLALTTKY